MSLEFFFVWCYLCVYLGLWSRIGLKRHEVDIAVEADTMMDRIVAVLVDILHQKHSTVLQEATIRSIYTNDIL